MRPFGEADYRQGAADRLAESRLVLAGGRLGGSVYLAGRGVEAIFRAVIWKNDPDISIGRTSLQSGHDLRQLLSLIKNLGLLRSPADVIFQVRVQRIARLWFNNMRFLSTRFIEGMWRDLGEVHKRRTMKKASAEFFADCCKVIERCEQLCQ